MALLAARAIKAMPSKCEHLAEAAQACSQQAKSSATAKAKSKAAAKKKKGYSPREHFVHQVAFLEQMVGPTWDLCFGALGTGIVGVVASSTSSSSTDLGLGGSSGSRSSPHAASSLPAGSSSPKVVESMPAPDGVEAIPPPPGVKSSAQTSGVESSSPPNGVGSASLPDSMGPLSMQDSAKEALNSTDQEAVGCGDAEQPSETKAVVGKVNVPEAAIIVIFVCAPGMVMQTRNGRTIANYGEGLDLERGELAWSSQRRDRDNRIINTIIDHCRSGRKVVVAVRDKPGCDFYMLGQVARVTNFQGAQFLLAEGDHVLLESGTKRLHKHITVACLHSSLVKGVGLQSIQYPVKKFKPSFCYACCYKPASCVFHFDRLEASGVASFHQPRMRILNGLAQEARGLKREAKCELPESNGSSHEAKMPKPLHRINTKTPRMKVKCEVITIAGDNNVNETEDASGVQAVPLVSVKSE